MQPVTAEIVGKRYQILNQLGVGGMGSLYRALDLLSGRTVALKRVTNLSKQLDAASTGEGGSLRMALAQEFQVLSSLHHPHIVGVQDYGFDDGRQPFFTMDLLENATTILEAAKGQPQSVQVGWLMQLLQALVYLHRRDVLHRDLKPDNVLVAFDTIKVVDFGLSVTQHQDHKAAGTLAYMAPEIISGEPASIASDLYAVGLIAYELFAGRPPFSLDDVSKLAQDIIQTRPDVASIGIAEPLAIWLARLLAKNPADRFDHAANVMQALSKATGQPVPQESAAIRESFLQAAAFVGREEELQALTNALDSARKSQGNLWLVGGESGVGKSRLMEEFRAQALVRGALAMRGHAVNVGGDLFQVWREPLRWLAMISDLSDGEASIVQTAVPDLGNLLGRRLPDATGLDPEAAQARLMATIEDIIRRQTDPIVIILHDMHWAGSESVALLNYLLPAISSAPVLVVATYRDDDYPETPEQFPGAQTLKLNRFTPDDLGMLAEAILGKAGREKTFVNYLHHETDGNVFFAVEVLRAMAEAVGELDKVDSMVDSLQGPSIFAGGVRRIIKRRVELVPDETRPLLNVAAVAGRELDLDLLRGIVPDIPLQDWLDLCANVAVLEQLTNRWRFSHNKMREYLFDEIPGDERATIHRQVAEQIEKLYPNDPERVRVLAYHWAGAGDSDKEQHYAALAGERALKAGAYREAAESLARALELIKQQAGGRSHADRLRRASLQRQLGEAHWSLGQTNAGREHYRQALALLGKPMPRAALIQIFSLLGNANQQFFHRKFPGIFLSRVDGPQGDVLLEAASIYERLTETYFFNNERLGTIYCAFRTLNIAERVARKSIVQARGYGNLALLSTIIRQSNLAETYSQLAIEATSHMQQHPAVARILLPVAAYYTGLGKWDEAREVIVDAINIADEAGDLRTLGDYLALLAWEDYLRGRYGAAQEHYERLDGVANRSKNIQHRGWAKRGLGAMAVRMEQVDNLQDAMGLLEEAQQLFDMSTGSRFDFDLSSLGVQMVVRQRRGESAVARENATAAAQVTSSLSPTTFFLFEGFVAPTEVALALWEARQASGQAGDLPALAKSALGGLKTFVATFPIGKPRYLLAQGLADWLAGQPGSARANWQAALALAETMDMPYEQALAHYQMGRHADGSDPERAMHLERAATIFSRLNTPYESELVRKALSGAGQPATGEPAAEIEDVAVVRKGDDDEPVKVDIDLSDL